MSQSAWLTGYVVFLLTLNGCSVNNDRLYKEHGGIERSPEVVGLPVYPGSSHFWDFPARPKQNLARIFTYKTPDATPTQVVAFYKAQLQAEGWTIIRRTTKPQYSDGVDAKGYLLYHVFRRKKPILDNYDMILLQALCGDGCRDTETEIRIFKYDPLTYRVNHLPTN